MISLRLLLFLLLSLGSLNAQDGKPPNGPRALQVQIFLDQNCFGPGFLDGKPGRFTSNAVYTYNRAQGRSPGDWAAVVKEAEAAVPDVFATATVPMVAKKFVNPRLPKTYEAQAKLKLLSYRSYLEFMAERYHTSESYLIELNGRKKAFGARPRSVLKVPNVIPFRIEEIRKGGSHPRDEVLSTRKVVIDTVKNALYIYDPSQQAPASPGTALVVVSSKASAEKTPQSLGKVIAMFPVTPGHERYIHRGTWKIVNSVEMPQWRYDKQLLKTGKRSKEALQIAGGPNNPVGVVWNGLSRSGIGIHGTSSPRTIGRGRSSGCYRLANWDVARFPDFARPGATVIVR